jgi:hypothetical protein
VVYQGGANTDIGAMVLGHLSMAVAVLHHLVAVALGVLEKAGERPHAVLALLPW